MINIFSFGMVITFINNRKSGLLGQVRDDPFWLRSNLFLVSGVRYSMIQELRDSGIEKF